MSRNAFIIIALFFIAQGAFAKSAPTGTGFLDVKTNVLIMLNTSSSMNSAATSGDSKYPYGVAFDSAGNIYVAKNSTLDNGIEKYTSAGVYEYSWGDYGTDDGDFHNPYAIAIDSLDNIYVSDSNNGRVQKFDIHGVYQSKFSVSTSTVKGIAVDSSGNIYAVNGNGIVEKFNSAGTLTTTWTNTGANMSAADTSDNLYVTRTSTKTIEKYNSSGTLQLSFSAKVATTGNTTYTPFGITVTTDGNIYVTDYTGCKLYKYNSAGVFQAVYGATSGQACGSTAGKMNNPAGLTHNGNTVWVADFNNNRITSPITSTTLFTTTTHQTQLDQAKIVLKDLVTNSNLTDGANFGLITYNSSASLFVPISSTGAASIYSTIDTLTGGGNQDISTAFTLAQSYLTGADSPITAGAWCQSTLIVVISNGVWQNTASAVTIAGALAAMSPSIHSFMVGADVSETSNQASNYIDIATAGLTYPDSPVFADSWQTIYESVSGYIQSVINANLTFSAPTIMPSVEDGDSILQSTFKYKTTHQWKGSLNKYSLTSTGAVGSLAWDAGTLLAAKTAISRNLWTVNTGLTTSLNNFTTANIDGLRVPMNENTGTALSDSALTSLIDFVRGIDSYGEFTGGVDDDGDTIIAGERWKLADIYHSRSVGVGVPSAIYSDKAATNTEAYYRYANGYAGFKTGSLCGTTCNSRTKIIYAGGNDGMLHAFDSLTGAEKWAFIPPSVLPNFKDIISTTASQSNSIYGVDGTPVIQDIYYSGAWHTVLLSGLRQGGKSYFALDITNPDAPAHLFTFAYNTTTAKVSYWAANGTRNDYTSATVPDAYNFFALGESWSKPIILRLPLGTNNAMKWTAVFGGGYNSGSNTSYGAKLFIIDMENGGQIINNIDIADSISTNGIVSAVPPTVTALTGDSTSSFTATGAIIYFSDLEGKLWKVNLTTTGTLYEATKLFNAESTSNNTRYHFQENAAALDSSGVLMQFFGTGNMQALGDISSDIANRIFGVKDTNFPNYTSIASMSTSTDLANVGLGQCPTSSQKGWYLNLNANEKVTAKATVKNGVVLFPRYTANATDICSSGAGSISEHSYICGTNLKTSSLGSGVPTEAVLYKNKIYIGISTDQAEASLPTGFTKEGNLIVGTPVDPATGTVHVESWWEVF